MTNEQEKQLIEAAKEAMLNAFTGTNKATDFRIGAAVLTDSGKIFGGGQYVSDSYTLTIHAEQSAINHAACHGEYKISAIAVLANNVSFNANDKKPVYPCHLCKQFMYESYLRSGINPEILICNEDLEILDRFYLLDTIQKPWPALPYASS